MLANWRNFYPIWLRSWSLNRDYHTNRASATYIYIYIYIYVCIYIYTLKLPLHAQTSFSFTFVQRHWSNKDNLFSLYTRVFCNVFNYSFTRERERERERERKENSSLLVATSLSEIRMYRLPARGAAAIFVFVVPENSKMARAVKVFWPRYAQSIVFIARCTAREGGWVSSPVLRLGLVTRWHWEQRLRDFVCVHGHTGKT